jgi:DNA-directed RNA polymerase subunit RPC12/RpoP
MLGHGTMSDMKFACPVCGQHITANSAASGTQMECPTCFQKIVVPTRSGDSKLIYSATKVATPRPHEPAFPTGPAPATPAANRPRLLALVSLMAAAALALSFVVYLKVQGRAERKRAAAELAAQVSSNAASAPLPWVSPHPIPEDLKWTLDLTNAVIPDAIAVGRVQGHGFKLGRATLQGGTLSFRQGKDWPPDLGITITLFAHHPEELSGKTIKVWPERPSPVPKVVLRWKDDRRNPCSSDIRSGYAMQLSFGNPSDGKIPGSIYICLPDDEKTFIAGRFLAEIRKPNPVRPAGGNRPPDRPKPDGTNPPALKPSAPAAK